MRCYDTVCGQQKSLERKTEILSPKLIPFEGCDGPEKDHGVVCWGCGGGFFKSCCLSPCLHFHSGLTLLQGNHPMQFQFYCTDLTAFSLIDQLWHKHTHRTRFEHLQVCRVLDVRCICRSVCFLPGNNCIEF